MGGRAASQQGNWKTTLVILGVPDLGIGTRGVNSADKWQGGELQAAIALADTGKRPATIFAASCR